MSRGEPHHWLALTYLPQFGGATLRRVFQRWPTLEAFFQASPLELAGLPPPIREAVPQISLERAADELAQLQQTGISLLSWDDPAYPASLYQLTSPPPVLFLRGRLPATGDRAVTIVGSRQVCEASLRLTRHIATELATAGFTIVSGLAIGIDTAAHQGALAAPQGQTIAILGNGLAHIYPPQNMPLADRLLQRGAIISEQRPAMPPDKQALIIRNRIMAALSRAVVVVEASSTSGALTTARHARQLGRAVWACPGSPGTMALLQAGARLLTDSPPDMTDLIEHLCQPSPSRPRWVQGRLFE